MKTLLNDFLKGCLVIVPTAVTVWVLWMLGQWISQWIPEGAQPIGIAAGVAIGIVAITLLGAFASNVIGRRVLGFFDHILARLPVFKTVYTIVRDLLSAFVGDERTFDRPVVVTLGEGGDAPKVLGFITCEDAGDVGVPDHVAVYLPHSMAIAGNLVLVPKARVARLETDNRRLLTFIASAGMVQGGTKSA